MDSLDASYISNYCGQWNPENEYVLFGSGSILEHFWPQLSTLKIKYIIDSNPALHGQTKNGVKICSSAHYLANDRGTKIIVTAGVMQILDFLTESGLRLDSDFTTIFRYSQVTGFHNSTLTVFEASVMVNTACTLKCYSCSNNIPHFSSGSSRRIDEIIEDIDAYFGAVDRTILFRIVGGEPLLHPGLPDILAHLGQRYRTRCDTVEVVTNGTLIPSPALLSSCKEYGIRIFISDYSASLSEKYPIERLLAVLEDNGVPAYRDYRYQDDGAWSDLGNPFIFQDLPDEKLKQRFAYCNSGLMGWCRHIYQKKLFYCGTGVSMHMAGICPVGRHDFVDLAPSDEAQRRRILAFDLGMIPGGSLSTCQRCNGFGGTNKLSIKPGRQIPSTVT